LRGRERKGRRGKNGYPRFGSDWREEKETDRFARLHERSGKKCDADFTWTLLICVARDEKEKKQKLI